MSTLSVSVGGAEFGIPAERVREVLRPPPVTRVPFALHGVRGIAQVRGTVLAVVDLGQRLGLAPVGSAGRLVVVWGREREAVGLLVDRVFGWEPAPDPRYVLVLRRGTRAAALGADRLLAQDAATVRALPAALGSPPGVSGAVVDARGRVVLLLDPEQMLELNVDLYRGGAGGG